MAIKNIHKFELNKGEKQGLSPKHFRLVKLSLDRLLLSRASLRFTLHRKAIDNMVGCKIRLLTLIQKY